MYYTPMILYCIIIGEVNFNSNIKLIRPNMWLLCCSLRLLFCMPPPAVKIMSVHARLGENGTVVIQLQIGNKNGLEKQPRVRTN